MREAVEHLDVIAGKDVDRSAAGSLTRRAAVLRPLPLADGARAVALSGSRPAGQQTLIRPHGARHAFAIADAALAAHFDFQNPLAGRVVLDDLHVAVLKVLGFVGPKAGVCHEQDEVVNLFGVPLKWSLKACAHIRGSPRRAACILPG